MRIDANDDASADCVRRRIEEQLQRLDVDYVDFYQIWSVNSRENYEMVVAKGGMLEGILKAVDEGVVRHIGFTTHDDPDSLISYMDEIDWCEVMLITYNLLNRRYEEVLAAAHSRGIGTILMNPVGGGRLAEPSLVLQDVAREVGAASVPELAIRWVLTNPNVDTIVPGIAKASDIRDAVAAAEAGPFSRAQMETISGFLDKVAQRASSFCTNCRYCMPCPHGVDIPGIMACIHEDRFWGLVHSARTRYRSIRNGKADACEECGECESKCTQDLPIIEELRYARERFASES